MIQGRRVKELTSVSRCFDFSTNTFRKWFERRTRTISFTVNEQQQMGSR